MPLLHIITIAYPRKAADTLLQKALIMNTSRTMHSKRIAFQVPSQSHTPVVFRQTMTSSTLLSKLPLQATYTPLDHTTTTHLGMWFLLPTTTANAKCDQTSIRQEAAHHQATLASITHLSSMMNVLRETGYDLRLPVRRLATPTSDLFLREAPWTAFLCRQSCR